MTGDLRDSARAGAVAHATSNTDPNERGNALERLGIDRNTNTDPGALMVTARNMLEVAAAMVERATTIEDITAAKGYAEALRVFVKHRQLGVEVERPASEVILEAEFRAGDELIRMLEDGERLAPGQSKSVANRYGRAPTISPLSSLPELGINEHDAKRWQQLARQYDRDIGKLRARMAEVPLEARLSRALLVAGESAISRKVKVYKDPTASKDEAEFDGVLSVQQVIAAVEKLRGPYGAGALTVDLDALDADERAALASDVEKAARLLVSILKVLRGGDIRA
jgi:hypothetical protein